MILTCSDDNVLFKTESSYFFIIVFNIYIYNKFRVHAILHKSTTDLNRPATVTESEYLKN